LIVWSHSLNSITVVLKQLEMDGIIKMNFRASGTGFSVGYNAPSALTKLTISFIQIF